MLAYVLLICLLRERISWKVLFGVVGVHYFIWGLFFFLHAMPTGLHIPFDLIRLASAAVVLLVLILTVAIDWKNYAIRDWLHWLGLFTLGYRTFFEIVEMIIQYQERGFS